jgi:hypothetical protein
LLRIVPCRDDARRQAPTLRDCLLTLVVFALVITVAGKNYWRRILTSGFWEQLN